MKNKLKTLALVLGAAGLATSAAHAQDKVKIGFITDMSSLYADVEGKNGAVAIQMAIDDFGGKVLGMPIELLTADHQNKADIAASKAREWIDTQGLTMLFGGTNSGTALASAKVAAEKKRVYINNGAASSALTNDQCTPYTVHYAYDTVAKAKGGNVVGAVRHPLNASYFSSFLLQAQSSKAQILGLANAGGDTINAIKAAKEFGIGKSMKLAGLLIFISDVHSLGLRNTEGLQFTTSWYWDLNDETRKFSARFFEKTKRMPTEIQAADYSATMNYLKAVEAAKTVDADKVMATWKGMKMNDFFGSGQLRADGRYVHDMYLMEVKKPSESTKPWDYYKLIKKLPGESVFTTKAESKCALWK